MRNVFGKTRQMRAMRDVPGESLRPANDPACSAPEAACASSELVCPAAQPAMRSAARAVTLHAPAKRAASNRMTTLLSILLAAAVLATVVVAGLLLGDAATVTDFTSKNIAPCLSNPFGTDWMGRDMLTRTLAGLSTSVLIGLLAAFCSSLIALILGAAAALGGSRVDAAVNWLVDLMMGIPHIVLLILISYALGKGFWGVTIGVAVTHWPNLTRVIRAEILQCEQSTYVGVARRLGRSRLQIAVQHMLPYVLPQFLVGLILMFPHAILHEAAVTFLGFGLSPEAPAIGIILSESMKYLSAGMWWLAVFPGLALLAVVLLFDVAGSGLRRLIDPNSSQD